LHLAAQKFEKALEMEPGNFRAQLLVADVMIEIARIDQSDYQDTIHAYSKACKKYRNAHEMKKNNHLIIMKWGEVLLEFSKFVKEGTFKDDLINSAKEKFLMCQEILFLNSLDHNSQVIEEFKTKLDMYNIFEKDT